MKKVTSILARLKMAGNPRAVEGMARYGIRAKNVFGVSMPVIRRVGKELGRDHRLAEALWRSGNHEARILASLVAEPEVISPAQMDRWAGDFDSWDVCDQVCLNLFVNTPHAHRKALQWSNKKREFVKRAGFSLMACLAVHDIGAADRDFEKFLPAIFREAVDERNFVRKAVNWALRQIGKRNPALNLKAIALAREIQSIDTKSARWIAADAIRELTGGSVQRRLQR